MSFPQPTTVYPDPITQLWQGNPVAYIAGALIFVLVGLIVTLVILKMKTPQLAWQLIKNNLRGGGAIIASVYENNVAKFRLPTVFQNGLAYDGDFYVFPKAYADTDKDLDLAEKELLMASCSIDGAPGQLYFNYAIQCSVATPKLAAMVQHEREIQKLQKGKKVKVPKALLIEVLNSIKDTHVTLDPMTICLPINVKSLRETLKQSMRKFDLKALENLVREWMKGQGTGVNWAMIAAILAAIGVIATILMQLFG